MTGGVKTSLAPHPNSPAQKTSQKTGQKDTKVMSHRRYYYKSFDWLFQAHYGGLSSIIYVQWTQTVALQLNNFANIFKCTVSGHWQYILKRALTVADQPKKYNSI